MNYRGIIIEESLGDKSILDKCEILKTKVAEIDARTTWYMHKVQIAEENIHEFTKELIEKMDPNGRWYSHFYHEDPNKTQMIVTFYKKRFCESKDNFDRSVEYGLQEGIPQEQLDFVPRDVADEEW